MFGLYIVVVIVVSFGVFWALKELLLRRAKGSFVSRDCILFGSVSANVIDNLGIIIRNFLLLRIRSENAKAIGRHRPGGSRPCSRLRGASLLEDTRSLIHIRRKFRSQTSDNMDREKQRWEESERRRAEERRSKKSNSEKKTDELSIFGRSDMILRGRCTGFYTLPKASKT
jgi:hypothetical protein